MPQNERTYIAIDLKSYYASVECMERGLDPMQTNLVVADPSRTEKTICLAVSPALKAYGIPGRARLFEVVEREQQMLAMGRALMSKPSIILMDEPSMGLSPLYVSEIFDIIQEINKSGTTVLLVEQNAKKALSIANRAYVLETGKIVLSGDAHELMNNDSVKKAYLGE